MTQQFAYQSSSKLDQNHWITDPLTPDPANIPVPLGWCLLVRPYPVVQQKTSIILSPDAMEHMNYVTNIGRVIAVGPCCWNRAEHKMKDGRQQDWVQVGDFVSFPKNVGQRRKFKGVSYVLLVDDEIVERLPDPQVFDDGFYRINIPEEHLSKYNTYRNQATTEPKKESQI